MNAVEFFSGKIGENRVDLDTFKKWFFSPSCQYKHCCYVERFLYTWGVE